MVTHVLGSPACAVQCIVGEPAVGVLTACSVNMVVIDDLSAAIVHRHQLANGQGCSLPVVLPLSSWDTRGEQHLRLELSLPPAVPDALPARQRAAQAAVGDHGQVLGVALGAAGALRIGSLEFQLPYPMPERQGRPSPAL